MGSCILTFEQMQLLNQMSDNDHRDNDWMAIVWAVNGLIKRKEVFQLRNDRNDWVLKSGDLIPRFESGAGSIFTENADALLLCDEDVKVTLYEIKQGSTHVGFWVRYQRYATALFTEADVMLVHWTPVQ